MVVKAVDDRALSLLVIVGNRGLSALGKITLRLKSVLQPVDNRPGRAEVSVGGFDLGKSLKVALWSQMISNGRNDMAAAGWQWGVLHGGLRFGILGTNRQSKAGWATVVGPGLAPVAEKLHFRQPFSLSSHKETG